MTEYEAPDPWVAEMVYRTNAASARQHARLRDQSPSALKAVVRDTNEPNTARGNALLFLLQRRDPELPDILLELFDDPDQELWRSVIRSYCPDDSRINSRLLDFLDDDNERNWSEAAVALARSSDETLLPRFEAWLHEGDRSHRNVAIECLKALGTGRGHHVLQGFWDRAEGDDEDRLVIAAALLSVGDNRGLSLLDSTARTAHGIWSVFAATSIYVRQSRDGLPLMMHILDDGDLEAKQAMVNQIWNFAHLPHAFTADGIHEARVWVQSEMEKQAT